MQRYDGYISVKSCPSMMIVRRTSLSRNTVKKWLRATEVTELQYRRRPMPTKLTPYEDQLKQALIADSHRPKRDQRTALMLLAELQESGYAGSYTRLTDYIRNWRTAGEPELGSGLPLFHSNSALVKPSSLIGAKSRWS